VAVELGEAALGIALPALDQMVGDRRSTTFDQHARETDRISGSLGHDGRSFQHGSPIENNGPTACEGVGPKITAPPRTPLQLAPERRPILR
jgi:hypothetical protein